MKAPTVFLLNCVFKLNDVNHIPLLYDEIYIVDLIFTIRVRRSPKLSLEVYLRCDLFRIYSSIFFGLRWVGLDFFTAYSGFV